jgi:hypothetical protein
MSEVSRRLCLCRCAGLPLAVQWSTAADSSHILLNIRIIGRWSRWTVWRRSRRLATTSASRYGLGSPASRRYAPPHTPLRSQYNQELRSLEGINSLARVDFHVFIEVPLTALAFNNGVRGTSLTFPHMSCTQNNARLENIDALKQLTFVGESVDVKVEFLSHWALLLLSVITHLRGSSPRSRTPCWPTSTD